MLSLLYSVQMAIKERWSSRKARILKHIRPIYIFKGLYLPTGNMYEISTKPTDDTPESYSELWFAPLRHEQVFAFLVAACKNARLALAVDAGQFDHGTYEIVIGGREEDSDVEFTAIRGAVGRNTTTRVKTTSILDCADQKDFWVSWKGQEIRLGSGQPFGSEILKYKIPIFGSIPRIVSMATGPKADGNWAFNTEQGNNKHYKTKLLITTN